jgi:hypothetical protein
VTRSSLRSCASLASVLVLFGPLMIASSSSAASACSVKNARTSDITHTLQAAIDASAKGDTLLIRGTCVGKAAIRQTTFLLKGIPTTEQPNPTLDAQGVSRVLYIKYSKVTVRDLTITGGASGRFGGGVYVDRGGRLAMRGTTTVTGNNAYISGGLYLVYDASVTMRDTASVVGNTSQTVGGGVYINAYNEGATLTMDDSSSIAGNATVGGGGGIYNASGVLDMRGASSVTGNSAGYGAGIANDGLGRITLSDSASVTGNTAINEGGGIYRSGPVDVLYVCSDLVAISPNQPDDPPETSSCV